MGKTLALREDPPHTQVKSLVWLQKVGVQPEPQTLASQLNLNRKPPVQLETLGQGNTVTVRKEEGVEVSLWPFQEHSTSV